MLQFTLCCSSSPPPAPVHSLQLVARLVCSDWEETHCAGKQAVGKHGEGALLWHWPVCDVSECQCVPVYHISVYASVWVSIVSVWQCVLDNVCRLIHLVEVAWKVGRFFPPLAKSQTLSTASSYIMWRNPTFLLFDIFGDFDGKDISQWWQEQGKDNLNYIGESLVDLGWCWGKIWCVTVA